ncbi:MAG TPA: asparaginase [Thermoanaerobaculia bacterium]|nr:asparaginase [Thermoanaerobaculia bacterium]
MIPLVQILRGGLLESVHHGSVAIADADGRLLAFAGSPDHSTFLRSAAKPFQALPLLRAGAEEAYELTSAEIALICASHGGEPHHVATAAAILRREELDESDLRCAAHPPLDERAAAELRLTGETPSPLHNNCSGKHAGMLLACALRDDPLNSYLDPHHPLQIEILRALEAFSGVEAGSIGIGIDGCGAPTFHLSLHRAAVAWARLSEIASGGDTGVDLSTYRDPARAVVEAMTARPDMVAGAWSVTTPLMQAFEGNLVGKEGAEGIYGIAFLGPLQKRLAEVFGLSAPRGIGLVLKIAGGAIRARVPAVFRCLEELGIDVPRTEALRRWTDPILRNAAGTEVGEVRTDFRLAFL